MKRGNRYYDRLFIVLVEAFLRIRARLLHSFLRAATFCPRPAARLMRPSAARSCLGIIARATSLLLATRRRLGMSVDDRLIVCMVMASPPIYHEERPCGRFSRGGAARAQSALLPAR